MWTASQLSPLLFSRLHQRVGIIRPGAFASAYFVLRLFVSIGGRSDIFCPILLITIDG